MLISVRKNVSTIFVGNKNLKNKLQQKMHQYIMKHRLIIVSVWKINSQDSRDIELINQMRENDGLLSTDESVS